MNQLRFDPLSPYLPNSMKNSARAVRDRRKTIKDRCQTLDQSSYGQFSTIYADAIPQALFELPSSGPNSRLRQFTLKVTFFLWLHQILLGNPACERMVIHARTWLQAIGTLTEKLSSSAYCQARKRLSVLWLRTMATAICRSFPPITKPDPRHLGFNLLVVDGTTFSLPDTPDNAAVFPLPPGQKPGCGFPVMPVLGLFSLATGGLVDWVAVHYRAHDCRLFPRLFNSLKTGDLLLADRAFSSYFNVASLCQRGVQYVGRLHQARKFPGAHAKRMGQDDYLVTWTKGSQAPKHYPQEWQSLPAELQVRLVKYSVAQPGFRTREVILVTTLLDAQQYPAEQVAELYHLRWQVELNFRDIKLTMNMDHLTCRTPEMLDKELLMIIIGYNLIQWLITRDAISRHRNHDTYSFSNAMSYVATIAIKMSILMSMSECRKLYREYFSDFGAYRHIHRPNRSEVRAVKRRDSNYKRMNRPRHEMQVEPHRNRHKAAAASPGANAPRHHLLSLT